MRERKGERRAEAFRDAAFIIHDTPPWASGTLALYSVYVCASVSQEWGYVY